MRQRTWSALSAVLALLTCRAYAQEIIRPEVVRLENVQVEGNMKTVYVGNTSVHYALYCNLKAVGCITPGTDKNYLLFTKDTRWKMPGAKDFISLQFVQEWTVKYKEEEGTENIGLVPEQGGSPDELGMFFMASAAPDGGYEADTIVSDGPISYGTYLSNEDRAKAWKHFWYQMVEAVVRQQGQDALGVKLAKRCQPGESFCTLALDANLVGIGGIQEPRKILLFVSFDVHDQSKQISRTVCAHPAKGHVVCRDWDTGKLVSARHP
jgi:hypothetical protein